ncbi:AMP-binding protein [Nocardia sp. NPDC052112]|uniref:AMP-binding protein n=1 Tax=Nocardia sp. NPDC052112 TaxID=3155646 RepID=UPI00341A4BBB
MSAPTVHEGDRLILFTSGSTGAPKAVALSEADIAAGIATVADHFALTPDDRTIALLPWAQSHGLFANLMATLRSRCTSAARRGRGAPNAPTAGCGGADLAHGAADAAGRYHRGAGGIAKAGAQHAFSAHRLGAAVPPRRRAR